MILSQFVGAPMRPGPHRQAHTRESRAWRWGDKMAQKGDFAGAGSFATASNDLVFFESVDQQFHVMKQFALLLDEEIAGIEQDDNDNR
jgi:hypothetical protein